MEFLEVQAKLRETTCPFLEGLRARKYCLKILLLKNERLGSLLKLLEIIFLKFGAIKMLQSQ